MCYRPLVDSLPVVDQYGHPTPRVVWLQGDVVVDSNYTETEEGEAYNSLEVPASRGDLTAPFVCRATNNDLAKPDDATYVRNVTSGPLAVDIKPSEEPLSEGRITRLQCSVVGSNPPPVVTWYQAGGQQQPLTANVVEGRNLTRSTLTLNISRADHGRELRCRAGNPLLAGHMEASFKLDVSYKPDVRLSLGRNLDPGNLMEGNDVFFVCTVDANPPPYKVTWYHEEMALSQDLPGGVLVSETTLVLQQVSRAAAGRYTCKASNVEGDTESNPVHVSIRYAPMCAVPPSLRGVALKESVNISCRVDADPPDVSFYWTFNNSVRREQTEVLQPHRYTSHKLESLFVYSPTSDRDYGTLLCYASNSVGKQEVPCSFTVISAGPPEEVTRCSAENITSHSCAVVCSPGFNGGLPQRFLLQIWDSKLRQLVLNQTEAWPEFAIRGLSPGHNYTASVTAYNSRGSAPPVPVKIFTVNEAQMHKSLPSRKPPSPMTLVLGIICGALLVVGALLLALWAVRGRRRGHRPTPESAGADIQGRVVGSGGLGMSGNDGIKSDRKLEVSDIQRIDKEEEASSGGACRWQPDPDILKSGTSLGSLGRRSTSVTPSSHLQDTPLSGRRKEPSGRPLLGGYDDLSPTLDFAGECSLPRTRTSVGEIMGGGDLVRRPGTGDLLRSRELLTVGELSVLPSTGTIPRGGMASSLLSGRGTVISPLGGGMRDSPSPVRGDQGASLRGGGAMDFDYDVRSSRGDISNYTTLSGSPRMTQHLLSGRDSIL